jgi:ADP-ribose pyrophosphatase
MPAKKSPHLKPRSSSHGKRTTSAPKLKRLASKTVFKGRVFSVTSDRVQEPNGVTAQREVVRHSGSVVVLALEESGAEPRVLLERQYRYAAEEYMLEVPAGRIDPGEDPLLAAKRELLEETGYTARFWKKALFFYPSPGFMDETMTVYLARGLKTGTAQPEEDERIECELVSLTKLVHDIVAGRIHDGKTIASVLWVKEYLAK